MHFSIVAGDTDLVDITDCSSNWKLLLVYYPSKLNSYIAIDLIQPVAVKQTVSKS